MVEIAFKEPKMLIGGELVDSSSGETFDTHSPSSGKYLASVPRGTPADVDRAVEAAKEGFTEWQEYSARERSKLLFEFASLLREQADRFGAIDAADGGNPITAMESDVHKAAENIELFAGMAPELKGETVPSATDTLTYTLRQPFGVVARIVPYNHPLMFAAAKIAAPLVAGNAVVVKPPEQAPISALELGRLIKDSELFPPGVINIVTGFGDEVGSPLVAHEDVQKIGFIGSVPTGKLIQQQAAENVTDVSLELGGKNPLIIYPDGDLDAGIQSVVDGMNFTWSQGQSCGSTTRLFLHESLYEEGIELLEERVRDIYPGDPMDEETQMGCLVSEDQYEKVMHYLDLGKESDATLLCGGQHPPGSEYEDGYFVEPTVFTDVSMDMPIAREEIFGPVLSVLKWENEDDVIEAANDVKFGLTASIFTSDVQRAHTVAEELEAGYVWINQAGSHFLGTPFGGWKESGIGREESIDEILAYTQIKSVHVKL